jgi:hypothetical protein
VDELLLNESVEYSEDGQTETSRYSVLCRNGSTSDVININFNNYPDYMDNWEKKLNDGKRAGTPARKVIRPIPEENASTNENPATNLDEQTTEENKGSIENADANEDKEMTVEKEGHALSKASKNRTTTRGKKVPRSKKASLGNYKSLNDLLESSDEEEDKQDHKYRMITNCNRTREFYADLSMTDKRCEEKNLEEKSLKHSHVLFMIAMMTKKIQCQINH